jgi:hypothetical protein
LKQIEVEVAESSNSILVVVESLLHDGTNEKSETERY